jgi:hypothetical protein
VSRRALTATPSNAIDSPQIGTLFDAGSPGDIAHIDVFFSGLGAAGRSGDGVDAGRGAGACRTTAGLPSHTHGLMPENVQVSSTEPSIRRAVEVIVSPSTFISMK